MFTTLTLKSYFIAGAIGVYLAYKDINLREGLIICFILGLLVAFLGVR